MRGKQTARAAVSRAAAGGPAGAGESLARRLREHLARTSLLPPGSHLLVAVSGGLDSVTLLHLLRFASVAPAARLSVAHFDHAMRRGSGADAEWAAGLCRAWGLPIETARAAAVPRNEAEARHARYEFLHEAARRAGADWILTAHHADDQAETVLFRALRGAGIRGLRGITERRGLIIRPLLPFRRRELEAYAASARLRYREDPTNVLTHFTRNRIRNEIMPRLEALVPGAPTALVRLGVHARELDGALGWLLDHLEREAVLASDDTGFELARPIFLSYHPHFRARLLRRLLRRLGSHPDSAGTRAALQFINRVPSGHAFHAPGGVLIEREFDRIRIRATGAPPPPDREVTIGEPGEGSEAALIGGAAYQVVWGFGSEGMPGHSTAFDASTLRFPLRLRGWRPGDRLILPFGTKKLKKLFAEHRIGRARRPLVPILADRDGMVLWVPGVARAALHERGEGPAFHVGVTDHDVRGNDAEHR